MIRRASTAVLALLAWWTTAAAADRSLVLVVGASGQEEFAPAFAKQVETWKGAATGSGASVTVIGAGPAEKPGDDASSDRQRMERTLLAEPKEGDRELWLILIGHGTFDGKEAKFNLRGPDVSADDLARWLKPIQRPVAVVVAASSSAPFLAKLSGRDRVVMVATRSGYEQNYSRFGQYLAEAVTDRNGDLDRDGQVSLLEAFLTAAHRTADFYKTDGRLATEHALIDDNGDGLGTPADWFRGTRAVKKPKENATLDGPRAHQWHLVPSEEEARLTPEARARRNALELELENLRAAKSRLAPEDYARQLEEILLKLARLYEGT